MALCERKVGSREACGATETRGILLHIAIACNLLPASPASTQTFSDGALLSRVLRARWEVDLGLNVEAVPISTNTIGSHEHRLAISLCSL